MILCPVRNCRLPLERAERTYACENRHSFDVARSGYVNLLQPQDRRSKSPGDTAEAVTARRRFFVGGVAQPLVDAIVRALPMRAGEALLDAGCGEGHHLEAFRRAYDVEGWGVDISVPAIELAAKSYRQCQWVVANADRTLPFPDGAFAAVASITARMNAEEFHRVLAPGGTLLVVLPGPDDLLELREAVLGEGLERDRSERTVTAFAPRFRLERSESLRHAVTLDRAAIHDVMASSYRGLRTREREKLEQLDSMPVTLARDLLLFRT